MTGKEWAHSLDAGVAAALGLFDPPERIDENLLARVLRQMTGEVDSLGASLFLRALADALDNPQAELRLKLGKRGRGRPSDKAAVEKALATGARVTLLVNEGWKKEAAVQQVMSGTGLSRSAVLRVSRI